MNAIYQPNLAADPHAQLRSLYLKLIENHEYFEEFKQLLSAYPVGQSGHEETAEAASVRDALNSRIREWTAAPFDGLTATQVLLWRSIVVEERINVALSPWKESNLY
jgi:hypothetical protein